MKTYVERMIWNMEKRIELKTKLKKIESSKQYVVTLKEQIEKMEQEIVQTKEILEKEQKDVDKLEHLSIAFVKAYFSHDQEERKAKEEKEARDAAFRYEQCVANTNALKRDYEQHMSLIQQEEAIKKELLEEEYTLLQQMDPNASAEVTNLREQLQENRMQNKEIKEALEAGNVLKERLEFAIDKLKSAQGWGIYDIVGGGLLSSMIKHERIQEAQNMIAQIQCEIQNFNKELRDIDEYELHNIEISEGLAFMDIAFDNIFSDFFTQNKIDGSLNNVQNYAQKVDSMMKHLQQEYEENEDEYDKMMKKQETILHQVV